jgi:hypothetical protein
MFTQRELGYLDDVMPEIVKKEIEERKNSIITENVDKVSRIIISFIIKING